MCGILGFIGKSVNPRVSYELAHALLVKTEKRGEHATGFWACEEGNNGKIFFDKEPVKSSVYVKNDLWSRQFAEVNSDLFVGHCRFTSHNSGHEKYNKNNHPHVSSDKRVALVHNGKILEYSSLKSRYDLRSDCDSEILLSMFEYGWQFKVKKEVLEKEFPSMPPDIAYRMIGLREVFSRVNHGAMAVAIAERGEENTSDRFLWLFRNDERTLWAVDMRKTLGQIFFCSEADIWRAAIEACPSVKPYIPNDQVIIEFPADQVWLMSLTPNTPEAAAAAAWESLQTLTDSSGNAKYANSEEVPEKEWNEAMILHSNSWRIKKFKISKTKFYDWDPKQDDFFVKRPKASKPVTTVVSRLSEDEEVVKSAVQTEMVVSAPKKKKIIAQSISNHHEIDCDDDVTAKHASSSKDEALKELTEIKIDKQEIDMESFDHLVASIREVLEKVEDNVKRLHAEESLTAKDFTAIMDSLKDADSELRGSLIFLS